VGRSAGLKYEPHIDGLRAIAVLSVIVYHANPNWLPGGFVGVDIFFVISGYLITKIIAKEIHNNTFTYSGFYKRRIKRILPAFLLVLVVTTGAGYLIYFPDDLKLLLQSGLSSLFFVSNMFFWHNTGYFAPESDVLPLLHTWSLSVEEQYYIFWPLCLFLILKKINLNHQSLMMLLCGALFAGILISEYLVFRNPSFGFYSLPSRFFELLIGAIVAIIRIDQVTKGTGWLLSVLGLILLSGSFFLLTDASTFPGVNAIYPAIGTALVILGGRNNLNSFSVLLSGKEITNIGLLSYSLYLWHWPVFAISRYMQIPFSALNVAALFSFIFLCSFLSYRYVEKPVIRSKLEFRPALIYLFVLPLFAYTLIFFYVQHSDGVYERYSKTDQQHMREIVEVVSSDIRNCIGEHHKLDLTESCIINSEDNGSIETKPKPSFVLWGDSHANHFRPMLEEMSTGTGYRGRELSFWGCPPLVGLLRQGVSFSQLCKEHNDRVFNHIMSGAYRHVVIAARWRGYFHNGSLVKADKSKFKFEDPIFDSLFTMIRTLENNKIKVSILKSVPTFPDNPSLCIIKNRLFFDFLKKDCRLPLGEYNKKNEKVDIMFSKLQYAFPELEVISMADLFCDDYYCYGERGAISLYTDKTHLSVRGAQATANILPDTSSFKSYFKNQKD
jgi:peptidoglycan/LPS O-acetylase OafA/YrhL